MTAGNGNGGPIHLNGAQVMVGIEEPNTNLRAGDTIILIDEKGGFGFDGNPANSSSNGASVGLLDYQFDLSVVENQLLAGIAEANGSEAATSLSEGLSVHDSGQPGERTPLQVGYGQRHGFGSRSAKTGLAASVRSSPEIAL